MDVSRYVNTEELDFLVKFVSPAIMRGANQSSSELRLASFKYLLRRWWRIYNGDRLEGEEEFWKHEARLFGSTEKDPDIVEENKGKNKVEKDEESFGKSKVQILLIDSNVSLISLPNIGKKINPEAQNREISLSKYTSYGADSTCIKPNKNGDLLDYYLKIKLLVPKEEKDTFVHVLSLIKWFGTMGGRSRNGWGSVHIQPLNKSFSFDNKDYLKEHLMSLNKAFEKNYPSGIVRDNFGSLVWLSKNAFSTVDEALNELAELYISLRQNFKFNDSSSLGKRHILGYPVLHHSPKEFRNLKRMPSQLIFKLCYEADKYKILIYHLAHKLPVENLPSSYNEIDIWKEVHTFIDNYKKKKSSIKTYTEKNSKGIDRQREKTEVVEIAFERFITGGEPK